MMHSTLNRLEKRWIVAFAFCALATRLALVFRPRWEFLPVGDDAFYVFSIARNMARGLGPTVDGTQITNGFQPLIVMLYTPIFWLCGTNDLTSNWLAVRWTFVLAGIIAAASVWVVAILIRELEAQRNVESMAAIPDAWATPPVIGAFLWTFSIAIFIHTTNGLETGLYSLMLLWSMLAYVRIRQSELSGENVSIARWMVLGIILGLTVLARIDGAILVLSLSLFASRQFRRISPIGSIAASLMAFAISLPWWLFNWFSFGSLMPTSGQAENLWPVGLDENIRRALQSITDIALLMIYAPDSMGLVMRAILAILIAVLFWWMNRTIHLIQKLRATRIGSLMPFAAFSLALLLYYTFFFKAPHFIARFLEPLRIVWLIGMAVGIPLSIERLSRRRRAIVIGFVAALTLGFGANRYIVNFFMQPGPHEFYAMGEWARAHPDEKIGMLQSGIASFIAPNVINLDGKVNTEALHAAQHGKLAQYLRAEHFAYLADWKPLVEDIAKICARDELFYDSVGKVGRMSHITNDPHSVQLMKLRDTH